MINLPEKKGSVNIYRVKNLLRSRSSVREEKKEKILEY
jgi:hypothetical protein